MMEYDSIFTLYDMTNTKGKARITITLKNDLLPLLDNFIDGEKIRNRSHAIEYILSQHLGLGIRQVVIFAGSNNKKEVPALMRVQNRSVIAYLFDLLKSFGIHETILVVDQYSRGHIEEYLRDGTQWGVRVEYIDNPHSSGTARALVSAQTSIQGTFILIYSDQLVDINLNDFVEHHQQSGAVGTVALTYKKAPGEYGVARMEGNKVVEYSEKPGKEGKPGLVNAGMYIFEPTVFDYIQEDATSLEHDVLTHIASTGQLAGYPFQGKWFDISRQAGLEQAEKEWR